MSLFLHYTNKQTQRSETFLNLFRLYVPITYPIFILLSAVLYLCEPGKRGGLLYCSVDDVSLLTGKYTPSTLDGGRAWIQRGKNVTHHEHPPCWLAHAPITRSRHPKLSEAPSFPENRINPGSTLAHRPLAQSRHLPIDCTQSPTEFPRKPL